MQWHSEVPNASIPGAAFCGFAQVGPWYLAQVVQLGLFRNVALISKLSQV